MGPTSSSRDLNSCGKYSVFAKKPKLTAFEELLYILSENIHMGDSD